MGTAALERHHTEDMMLGRPKHTGWLVGTLAVGAIVTVIFLNLVLNVGGRTDPDLSRVYEIPPSFGGQRVFYAGVLALVLYMSGLAMGATIENFRYLFFSRGGIHYPAKTLVLNETILLMAIVCSVLPDALVLMAWGENTAPSGAFLSQLNRAFDALSAGVFTVWLWRRTRSRPVLLFQLQREPIPVDMELTWAQLRPKLMIAMAIIVVSFGVAFGK